VAVMAAADSTEAAVMAADHVAAALPMDSVDHAGLREPFTAGMRLTPVTDTMLPVEDTVAVTGRDTRLIAPTVRATAHIEAGATVLIITDTDIGHTGGATAPTGGDRIPGGRTTRGGVTPTGGGRLTILTGHPMDTTGTGAIRE
jgi:hypothetical protein